MALQQPAAVLAQGAVGTQPEHRQCDQDQACGELAGCLSAVAALPAPGILERDFSSSSTFFPEVSMKTSEFVRAQSSNPLLTTPHVEKSAAPR